MKFSKTIIDTRSRIAIRTVETVKAYGADEYTIVYLPENVNILGWNGVFT